MARAGVCLSPSTTRLEYCLGLALFFAAIIVPFGFRVASRGREARLCLALSRLESVPRYAARRPKRETISAYSARTACTSAPTGRPGRSRAFQAYRSTCSHGTPLATKRRRKSAPGSHRPDSARRRWRGRRPWSRAPPRSRPTTAAARADRRPASPGASSSSTLASLQNTAGSSAPSATRAAPVSVARSTSRSGVSSAAAVSASARIRRPSASVLPT